MLPVNTVHVYMCTIVPTLNSIQSPCLHLAVITVYHTEFLRLRQFKEKYIYTLSNSQFFFPSKILVHAPAFKLKSACSVRHSINTHPCPETKSISIPTPPPPHTIKPRIS